MDYSNLCSILVMSCDKYKDAWEPFFKMFSIMWPDCPFKLYLCTESLQFSSDGMDITCLNTDKKSDSWSIRLKKAISKIDTKYILFFLEDFFVISPVRSDVVYSVLNWFENDKSVGFVDFNCNPNKDELINGEFSETLKKFRYRLNTQAGIWRKDYLYDVLRDEDPWTFETYASFRSRKMPYKVFSHRKEYPMVFEYYTENKDGYGLRRGKWLDKNPELFDKYDIKVDFSNLGFLGDEYFDYVARDREKNWFVHDLGKAIINPKKLVHYIVCVKNILREKIWLLRGRFFNK